MSVHYFMGCDSKLFATVHEANPIIITSWNRRKLNALRRMMRRYHRMDGRIMNCYMNMRSTMNTKVDILTMSSYADLELTHSSSEMFEDVDIVSMDASKLYDWHRIDQLHKLSRSGLFVLREFDYSITEDILTLQGVYLHTSARDDTSYDLITYLKRNIQ